MKKSIMVMLCGLLAMSAAWGGGRSAGSGASGAVPFNETGFPIVNQPTTLRVIGSKKGLTIDYPLLPVFQELEKKTGITIVWEYASETDWTTQKNLVFASGNLPDFFMGDTVEEADVLANPGMFIDLEPLIQKYGDNIKAMFRTDPNMERLSRAYDGKIYGLPGKLARRPETYMVMGINQTWLNKLGLAMPTTTEEFYTVLKAFKERDPNGNGIADEIPWSGGNNPFDDNGGIMPFFSPFGVVNTASFVDPWLSVTNGKVQYIAAQDGFKDAITYFHRLYVEGLLDQDVFAMDWAVFTGKTNPPAGSPEIVGVAGFWSLDIIFGPRETNYSILPVLKGPTGFQAYPRNSEEVQASRYRAEIPSTSKNPEIVMRWIDCLYDPLTSLRLYYGDPATQANGDGTYDIIGPPAGSGIDPDTWVWANALQSHAASFSDALTKQIRNDFLFGSSFDQKLTYAPYYKEYFPTLASRTPAEANELALLRTDIHGFAQEQAAKWIRNGGVEREYDAFVRQLNNMGLARMVAIYQGIYNRYMGK
jgi:putative aldouronate transport system substrate-binding protein